MGREYYAPKDSNFHWWSRKSESFLRSAISCRVWIISGKRKGSHTVFHLAGTFKPTEILPESDGFGIFGTGTAFQPPIDVTEFPWFSDLLLEQTNFSFGFVRIRSEVVIAELERILTDCKHK